MGWKILTCKIPQLWLTIHPNTMVHTDFVFVTEVPSYSSIPGLLPFKDTKTKFPKFKWNQWVPKPSAKKLAERYYGVVCNKVQQHSKTERQNGKSLGIKSITHCIGTHKNNKQNWQRDKTERRVIWRLLNLCALNAVMLHTNTKKTKTAQSKKEHSFVSLESRIWGRMHWNQSAFRHFSNDRCLEKNAKRRNYLSTIMYVVYFLFASAVLSALYIVRWSRREYG